MSANQWNSKAQKAGIRGFLERLGPYQSLAILAVPVAIVEPLKVVAVAVAGKGHWFTGTIVIVLAYAASLLLVHRLFGIVKPKLLRIRWFARLWAYVVQFRNRAARWLQATAPTSR